MRKVMLGKSGLEVSAVGFGGIPIQRVSDDEAVRAIRTAMDLGVTLIDTAAGYADSQRKIGLAIQGRRDEVVLASKSGDPTRDGILADIDRARREMGADVIDLYQFHGVGSDETWAKITGPGGAMEGVLEAREKGWIAHIGFSSHSLDMSLRLVDEPIFETVQFPFNLVTNEPADELIPKARENQLGFLVMKPMCGGQFDDAELAFAFLNAWPDLVPIPGIEWPVEIEQIVGIVESGRTLAGEARARADEIVAELGKVFCRRCGYCTPCPNNIPVPLAMIFDSFPKRMPPNSVLPSARRLVETIPQCDDCGQCEDKCPYDLPIRKIMIKTLDTAEKFVVRHTG